MLAILSNLLLFSGGGGESGGYARFFNDYLNYPGFEAWKFINLAIFITIMVYLLKKPLSGAFKAKRDVIRAELIKAEEEKQAALAKLSVADAKLSQLDAEANKIIEKAQLDAEAEETRIAEQAELESKRLFDQANSEIERKTKQVKNELKRFSAEESVRLAEVKIRRSMNATLDEKLVKAGIKSIGGLG
jgi:F-type H+-transporting ATPase subunit b